jgi:DNA modification methylase
MVIKNSDKFVSNPDKKFARKDTSYSSIWLFNKELDINSVDLKDKFVNFYNERELLSEFNPTVAKNVISYWSKPNDFIFDPFAGRSRALVAYAMNRNYIGYEISEDVYDYIFDRFKELKLCGRPDFNVVIEHDDCINAVNKEEKESFDLVFSCPPYHNLEEYESCPGQLSDIKDYYVFMNELVKRLNIAVELLKKDGYMCIIVGDFRRKNTYYMLHNDLLIGMMENNHLKLHDIIVIQSIPFHTAAFYFGSNNRFKRTAKCHEYLLIWKKVL